MITCQEYYPRRSIKSLSGEEWERYAMDLYREAITLEQNYISTRNMIKDALGLYDSDELF